VPNDLTFCNKAINKKMISNLVIKHFIKFSLYLFIVALALISVDVLAHGVDDKTRTFLEENTGVQFVPFLYIGAKHMITGYDHILFLIGVIFFPISQ
jgi:hypothetical protein